MNPLHYPDLERCKKLTEIGFPETELFYSRWANKARVEYFINREEYSKRDDRFLCPSVMEMLDVIGLHVIITKKDNHAMVTVEIPWMKPVHFVDTLPNALADLTIWLHENKYLKF